MRLLSPLLLAALFLANAQKYAGPAPAKADLPYIRHAANLIATEPVDAKEQKSGADILWTIDGANSPSKTPLALPIFVIKADKQNPASLADVPLGVEARAPGTDGLGEEECRADPRAGDSTQRR
jgi:hypothetical protein